MKKFLLIVMLLFAPMAWADEDLNKRIKESSTQYELSVEQFNQLFLSDQQFFTEREWAEIRAYHRSAQGAGTLAGSLAMNCEELESQAYCDLAELALELVNIEMEQTASYRKRMQERNVKGMERY